tara:strand:- start:1024 stop:1338 length:315 start_codon:yes stop_codon:yes gene_type:complete
MTKKQRVSLWRRMSQCFHHHEMQMIEQERKKKMKSRMDIIGQNGNDGEHYDQMPDGRWNWYGEAEEKVYHKVDGRHPEPDATGMDDELPSAAEDCARVKGNYEL